MLGQTIAVVDRSGKVVKSSQHLMDVFREAKSAYLERKAEITASKKAQDQLRHPRRAYTVDENMSNATSRNSHRGSSRKKSTKRRHSGGPPKERAIYPESEAAFKNAFKDSWSAPQSPISPPPPASPMSPQPHRTTRTHQSPGQGIHRRQTVKDSGVRDSYFPPVPARAMSTGAIDMDLAYGEPPPNLFTSQVEDETELKGLVSRVKGLLDEANCLQYSATRTIATLQKNPDAMAAVALSLAEISNLVKKMSPTVLLQLKSLAPSVFALLASPQFMIAAGVGVGVTIVAFGGYKIVKKIQQKKAAESQMEEMIELSADVSRIDQWRRGIALAEAESVGTSVDGEFITPTAAAMSRLDLKDESERREGHRTRSRTPKTVKTSRSGKSASSRASGMSKPSKAHGERDRNKNHGRSVKEKKPSPLRLMFS